LSNSRIEFSLRKGSYQPEEYPYYWRVFETNDDYFDYYRPYHAFSKLYRIGIPDEVLKKVYYERVADHAAFIADRMATLRTSCF